MAAVPIIEIPLASEKKSLLLEKSLNVNEAENIYQILCSATQQLNRDELFSYPLTLVRRITNIG